MNYRSKKTGQLSTASIWAVSAMQIKTAISASAVALMLLAITGLGTVEAEPGQMEMVAVDYEKNLPIRTMGELR